MLEKHAAILIARALTIYLRCKELLVFVEAKVSRCVLLLQISHQLKIKFTLSASIDFFLCRCLKLNCQFPRFFFQNDNGHLINYPVALNKFRSLSLSGNNQIAIKFMDPFVDTLRQRLAGPLPGRDAQYKMASMLRLQELSPHPAPPVTAQIACVLNLWFLQNGIWHTVLIERTANPRDRHSGQVSFPGGRWEATDGELANVALREAEEEVGVPARHVEILGQLTDLYIPVSNFLVHPFVGLLHTPVNFQAQPGEVEAILTPALSVFLSSENRKQTDVKINQGITLQNVPYFEVEGRIVWGATAMIMNEFLELLV
jgi:8-oxo-dGTP pyrophosphatase MutT (NUDIX family)